MDVTNTKNTEKRKGKLLEAACNICDGHLISGIRIQKLS